MKIYTVHGIDSEDMPARFIVEGFSWGAFWFGPAWAMAHGLWMDAALVLIALITALTIGTLIGGGVGVILVGLVAAIYGHLAHDRRRQMLRLSGITSLGVISAESELHAAHRWLEQNPALARRLL